MRYDLTVPLARVVANYKNELPKFFKRYQIQPVWRADRPAKGGYREFYQCDVDAIGSSSMIVEAELCAAVSEILERLGFKDFMIRLNNREVLTTVLKTLKVPDEKQVEALVAIDKLDKIGTEGVSSELIRNGIPEEIAEAFINFHKKMAEATSTTQIMSGMIFSEANEEKEFDEDDFNTIASNTLLDLAEEFFQYFNKVSSGIYELKKLLNLTLNTSCSGKIRIDLSLARGLSYYTGAIFEVILTNGDFQGSIAGGGRYDGLIGMFGKEEIPAVGFSIGLERILFVMEERGMFPENLTTNSADVMITIWNEESAGESLKLAGELRATGLRVLVYPEADKLGKQFKYADSINIPYVCVFGETELAENKVSVKNLKIRRTGKSFA